MTDEIKLPSLREVNTRLTLIAREQARLRKLQRIILEAEEDRMIRDRLSPVVVTDGVKLEVKA